MIYVCGCLFLRFKDGHEICQINPPQTLMNLQYLLYRSKIKTYTDCVVTQYCLTLSHFKTLSLLVISFICPKVYSQGDTATPLPGKVVLGHGLGWTED